MNWIDGHLDLAYIHLNHRDLRHPCPDPEVACITLPELRDGNVRLAFGTIFTEPDPDAPDDPCGYPAGDADAAFRAGMKQIEVYEQLEEENLIRIVRSQRDLDSLIGDDPDDGSVIKIVLLMEGADPIRSPDDVAEWFDHGLCLVGLTWWRGTRYAGGNGAHGPLTDQGVELVHALDEAGIIHDASHLADESFDGLLEHATGPIVASHSNCRALMDGVDQRHLRDDQIQAIGERGGIIGLNLYSQFLVPEGRATIADCVNHVQHICDLMGHRQGVAMGSDADGGFAPTQMPADCDHPRKYTNLAEALRTEGWTDDELEGFACGNWLRILRNALP